MYLRTFTGRTKVESVQYLQLAHNFRNPNTCQSQPRILYNFGRLDQVDRAALERLARSSHRFLDPGDAAGLRSSLKEQGLSLCANRSLGGVWLLGHLWYRSASLDLRPVYHRLADRIRAHVLFCWLAVLLVRMAEKKPGLSWPVLRRELERMAVVVFKGPGGGGAQRTVTTGAQRRVLQALGLEEPPMVFALSPKGSRAP